MLKFLHSKYKTVIFDIRKSNRTKVRSRLQPTFIFFYGILNFNISLTYYIRQSYIKPIYLYRIKTTMTVKFKIPYLDVHLIFSGEVINTIGIYSIVVYNNNDGHEITTQVLTKNLY
jgi:hypothetical protein